MKVRLCKDYQHYEILYDSQEEAQAVVDYLDQLLVRGVDIPKVSGVTGKAYFQHERETSTS